MHVHIDRPVGPGADPAAVGGRTPRCVPRLAALRLVEGGDRGIAISVVIVGAILAASIGIVGASVITMGLVSLPTMLRRGYSKELITGTICASGTLGQIIASSVILILLGDIMGVSVGYLYIGAFLPGFVLVGLFIA